MAGDEAQDGETAEGRGFLARVGRRWPWIVVATALGLVASAAFVRLAPPRYEAVARVALDARQNAAETAPALVSDDLVKVAMGRLGLAATPESVASFRSELSLAPVASRPREVEIRFAASDPALATAGADAVVGLLVEARNQAKTDSLKARQSWLQQQIDDWKGRAADADAKLEAARGQASLVADTGAQGGGDDASALAAKLAAARAAQTADADKAELLRRLDREGRLAEAPASAGVPLRTLLDQRAAVRAEIAEASRTLLPLHPRMKELAVELAGVEGQIHAAADKAARASEADARRDADTASALEARLAEQSAAQSKAAQSTSAAGASLHAAEAEAEAARRELAAYQQMARGEEAEAAADHGEGAARIVERAEPLSAPATQTMWRILALGAAAGFVLSTLVAAVAALASGALRAPAPAPYAPPPEPEAPMAELAAEPVLAEPPPTGAAPAGVLTTVEGLVAALRRMKPKGGLVVLIAGDRNGQALAIALESARRLAADHAAVLIDLGETQDWFPDILYREEGDDRPIPGLGDLIAGRAGFAEAIRRDLSSSLDVVLAGEGGESGGFDDALAAFSAAYTAVVIHASDWRGDWARAAAAHADAVVVAAPAARASSALDAAEAELGDRCPTVLALAVRAGQRTLEAAA